MKKSILFFLLCFSLSYSCMSQDCELKLRSAMSLFEKGDYYNARNMFAEVVKDCGKGEDYGGALGMIRECESKINTSNNATLSVSNKDVSFGPQGGEEAVKVTSSTGSWSFGKCPEWVHLSKAKGQLIIECDGNSSGEEREADITLYSGEGSEKITKKIHVSQVQSILSTNITSIVFPEYGGKDYSVQVNSNDDWDVISKNGSWYGVQKSEDKVLVSCEENPLVVERSDVFFITTFNDLVVEIEVSQRKAKPRLEMKSSVVVPWNAESYTLLVDSNDPNWEANVISGGSWCKAIKQNDRELLIEMQNNDLDNSRTAVISVSIANLSKEVTITQRVLGYVALYEDYFNNIGGSKRITKASASAYGFKNFGLRVSAFMYRWKVVEIDLINLNTSLSQTFQLSWEPMVRGYLPLQRDGYCWTAYMGFGRCVSFVDTPLKENNISKHSKILFEMGAECKLKWKGYENISSRFFLRIDGYASLGVALDLYEWK